MEGLGVPRCFREMVLVQLIELVLFKQIDTFSLSRPNYEHLIVTMKRDLEGL